MKKKKKKKSWRRKQAHSLDHSIVINLTDLGEIIKVIIIKPRREQQQWKQRKG